MNKNKIISTILVTTLLLETFPMVDAYNDEILDTNTGGITENKDIQYDAESEVDLDMDVVEGSNNFIGGNDKDIENSEHSVSIESLESDINVNNNQDIVLSEEITLESIDNMDVKDVDVKTSNVLEITLTDGEYVPDLTNNPNGYDTIRVTTIGNKKLVSTDYSRLRESLIPNIDLSQAMSDSIPSGVFSTATHLTSFHFPQGIKSIDSASHYSSGAFYNCTGLTGDLIIPDSVTSIGNYAFRGCTGLTGELIIPDSVTSIGNYAFYKCSGLTGDLIIPDSVTSIGGDAFRHCNGFTGELKLSNSLTYIGQYAFEDCSKLTGDLVLPNSLTSINKGVFSGCRKLSGNLVIPDSITSIGDEAFYYCDSLTGELVIPDSVITIGDKAFHACKKLTGELVIPDSVTSIGQQAFIWCEGLTGDLVIPDSVTTLGASAFNGCTGFDGKLVISNSLTSIPAQAFKDCVNLTGELVIPDSVISIRGWAFRSCEGFTGDLIIPDSVTSIDEYAFSYCTGLNGKLKLPQSVTTIGNYAFYMCTGLTGELNIPDSVTSIGDSAFDECSKLTGNLVLPDSISNIGPYAFYKCSGFTGDLIIPSSITTIKTGSFQGCSGLNGGLTIPDSVTTIDKYAFSGCSKFTGDLIIPDSVVSIGEEAFMSCGFNGNLKLSNSLSSIAKRCFMGCNRLTGDIIIPDSVISIGEEAFTGCKRINGTVVIPDSVTSIGRCAFYYCSLLSGDILIPNSVTSLGSSVFDRCPLINKIVFSVDESFADSNYRENIFEKLDTAKVVVDMSYNFDTSGTWLDNLELRNNGKPIIQSEVPIIEGKSSLMSLYIPTPYKEENIVVLKDGEIYPLPTKTTDGKYLFDEEGIYNITITTELGLVSNINFEVSILVNKPDIQYNNGLVSIIDNGHNVYGDKEICKRDDFEDSSNNVFELSNNNWTIVDGVLKSENIGHANTTQTEFKINAVQGSKLRVGVRVSSESRYDCGSIVLNGTEVYRGSGNNSAFETVELNLVDGENTITFKYAKDSSDSQYEDAMFIDFIEFSGYQNGLLDANVEYRLNGGEWRTYTGPFRVPDELVNGMDDIKVEARTMIRTEFSEVTESTLNILKAQMQVEDIEITQGDDFDELDYVTAIDIDGSDISDDIEVVRTDVKIDTPGEYKVLYEVEGSNGYITEKEITVRVNPIIINKPSIKYENNLVSIIDNGNNSNNKVVTIEYRINNGEWKTYSGEFRIPDEFVNGIDSIKVEARAIVGQYTSDISESNLTIPKAEIIANDIEVVQGSDFDELDYVTATDVDDSDISDKVIVVSSNVNPNTPGQYKVKYKVKGQNGYFTEKEIKVTVLKRKQPPVLIANDVVIEKGEKVNPLDFVTAVDGDGNDIDKSEIEIVDNGLDVSVPGEYTITYRIVDDNGLESTKTISVVVKDISATDGIEGDNSNDNDNEDNNKDNNNKNDATMPATGGLVSVLCLVSIGTMLSGCWFISKRKK